MKLISKETYKQIEYLLLNYDAPVANLKISIDELNNFFAGTNHYKFIQKYYYDRHKYKYTRREELFKNIYRELYVEEPTLYAIKKEVIYKAAMIFYKNGVLK